MTQIITKLSERRALAKAKKECARSVKFIESLDPETVASFEAGIAEKYPDATPRQIAAILIRGYVAEEVKEYTRKAFGDALPNDGFIEGINGETIEELLETMVEGDEVLDDDEVHAFHRRKLDELRASLARLEDETTLVTLAYEAIHADFATASNMMKVGLLDKATECRVAHIRIMIAALERLGHEATEEEAKEAFHTARVAAMAGACEHGMTIAEIADALDGTIEDVTACLAFLDDKGLRTGTTKH